MILYQNQDTNPDLSDFMVNVLKHETIQLLQSESQTIFPFA